MKTVNQLLKAVILVVLLNLIYVNAHAQTVTSTYYHTDALGSIVAASDEQGDIIWKKTYDPYGNEVISTEDGDEFEGQAYTGKPYDEETGLVYLGQRYYDPQIKRFMGMDSVGFRAEAPVSFNRYAYANNNPYKFIDPDGRQSMFAFTGCIAAGRGNDDCSDLQSKAISGQARGTLIGSGAAVFIGCQFLPLCSIPINTGMFAASGDPLDIAGSGVFKIGVNITPLSTANKFSSIMSPSVGRAFVTEPKAIESIIGPLSGNRMVISADKARQLEKALGLNVNSLESKNIISIVDDIPSRLPASPVSGNQFFLGGGTGLPGGGSELIIPAIPTAGGGGITQIILEVR